MALQVTQNMQQSRVGITAFKSWLCSCQQPLSPADNQKQRHCFPVPWNDRWPAWIWASPQLVQSMPKSSPSMDGHIPRVFLHSRNCAAASTVPFLHVGKNQECWSCGSRFLTPCATSMRGPAAARMEPGDQHCQEVDFGGLERCLGAQPCCLKAFSHAPPRENSLSEVDFASPERKKAQIQPKMELLGKLGMQGCKGWRVAQAPDKSSAGSILL